MACSPVPKVGGAAALSAPPVPTPMVMELISFNNFLCESFSYFETFSLS